MFSQLFEERDRKITLLVKLGDCLGRSLRENVILFSIDANNKEVSYLTESDRVISGQYVIGKDVQLKNIQVRDSSIFENTEKYDDYVSSKMHSLVESVWGNNYLEADGQFNDILSLWESRLKFETLKQRLVEKTDKIKVNTAILDLQEFKQTLEITPQIVNFLKDNKSKFATISEIKNAVCLSDTVAQAFNFPPLSFKQLVENKNYILKDAVSESVYEMICKQELIKKELVESKASFSDVWATSKSVVELVGLIYEKDAVIVEGLIKAINEVPYLAFVSKGDLFDTFFNCLDEGLAIPEKDIKAFANKIFEFKKEVRDIITELLSEKYGVNLQNLKEPPSFKSLVNTQVIIFETISRLAPNGSIIKKTLSELAEALKGKAGVESIDVNDYIAHVFESAGYGFLTEKNKSVNRYTKVDMKRLQKDIEDIRSTIDLMKGKLTGGEEGGEGGEGEGAPGEEEGGIPEKGGVPEKGKPGEEDALNKVSEKPEMGGEEEGGGEIPEKGGKDEKKPAGEKPEGKPGEEEELGDEGAPGEEGGMEDPGMEEPTEEKDVMADLGDLEAMIDNLTAELGFGNPGMDKESELDTDKKTPKEKDGEDQDLEDEE